MFVNSPFKSTIVIECPYSYTMISEWEWLTKSMGAPWRSGLLGMCPVCLVGHDYWLGGSPSNFYSKGWDPHHAAVARPHFSLAVRWSQKQWLIGSLNFLNSTIIGLKYKYTVPFKSLGSLKNVHVFERKAIFFVHWNNIKLIRNTVKTLLIL